MNQVLSIWQISRRHVERGDASSALDKLSTVLLLRDEELACLMGTVRFEVVGYGRRLVFDEPEVRRFFQILHGKWPYWLFFCDLNHESFINVIACMLPSVQTIRRRGCRSVNLTLQTSEVLAFFKECVSPFDRLCRRAGLQDETIRGHVAHIRTRLLSPPGQIRTCMV